MFTNRSYKALTFIFGCLHILLILAVLSQAAVPIVTDWRSAVQIVPPCALNILFVLLWMIGAGLRRALLIAMFKYFTYVQMALIALLIVYDIFLCFTVGLHFHLFIVIFILSSLFVLSLIELFIATGTEQAVTNERNGTRMQSMEMTEWSLS